MTITPSISREAFNRLDTRTKRVAVAKDLLARLKLRSIIGAPGRTFSNLDDIGIDDYTDHTNVQGLLNDPSVPCEACAKGALLATWVGLFDSVHGRALYRDSLNYAGDGPPELINLFGQRLLSALEVAFEHETYSWDEGLTREEERLLIAAFPQEDPTKRLKAIYTNLVENGGRLVVGEHVFD